MAAAGGNILVQNYFNSFLVPHWKVANNFLQFASRTSYFKLEVH